MRPFNLSSAMRFPSASHTPPGRSRRETVWPGPILVIPLGLGVSGGKGGPGILRDRKNLDPDGSQVGNSRQAPGRVKISRAGGEERTRVGCKTKAWVGLRRWMSSTSKMGRSYDGIMSYVSNNWEASGSRTSGRKTPGLRRSSSNSPQVQMKATNGVLQVVIRNIRGWYFLHPGGPLAEAEGK